MVYILYVSFALYIISILISQKKEQKQNSLREFQLGMELNNCLKNQETYKKVSLSQGRYISVHQYG